MVLLGQGAIEVILERVELEIHIFIGERAAGAQSLSDERVCIRLFNGGIWMNAILAIEAANWQVFISYLGLSLGLVVR